MKIQLDTDNKVIKVEEQVTLSEFIDTIDRLLPNGAWREFKLETNTVINWRSNPTIIDRGRPFRWSDDWFDDWYVHPWISIYNTPNFTTTGVYGIKTWL